MGRLRIHDILTTRRTTIRTFVEVWHLWPWKSNHGYHVILNDLHICQVVRTSSVYIETVPNCQPRGRSNACVQHEIAQQRTVKDEWYQVQAKLRSGRILLHETIFGSDQPRLTKGCSNNAHWVKTVGRWLNFLFTWGTSFDLVQNYPNTATTIWFS
jgi:hypothetical protein